MAMNGLKRSEKSVDCNNLKAIYKHYQVENAENLFEWYLTFIKADYDAVLDSKLIRFLRTVRRMKFTPIILLNTSAIYSM